MRTVALAGCLLLAITGCRNCSDNSKTNPAPTASAATPAPPPLVRDVKKIVKDPFPVKGLVYGLAYSADGRRLVSASSSDVRVFDAETGALQGVVGTVQSSFGSRSAVSSDAKLAAIAF